LTFQYSPAGQDDWTSMPAHWNTTLVPDDSYDLRVIVTDHAGNSTTPAVLSNRTIDNTVPSLTVTSPADGALVNASSPDPLTISALATDGGSGVVSVSFGQCSDTSVDCATGVWSTINTDTTSPYQAAWNIPSDGNGALRVVSTDAVGREATVVHNVTVDRTAPPATLDDPGANLGSTVSLTASATDAGGSGVNSVSFQYSPAGQSTWTE